MDLPSSSATKPASEKGPNYRAAGASQSLEISGATVAEAFVLSASSTVREAVRWAAQLDPQEDPEVFHKLRVALRRMRSLWWAYGPLLDKGDAANWRAQFKTLANIAGKTRDWDILQGLLTQYEAAKHPRVSLLMFVASCRSDAALFSCKAIREADVKHVLNRAVESARHQLTTSAETPAFEKFIRSRVLVAERALEKRLRRATSHGESSYAALHEVRIAGKRLRYLLEFFSPVLDIGHRETIKRLKATQDELGELNDVVASEALLQEYGPQFGQREIVDAAVSYLHDQKKRRVHRAYETLRHSR
ncbi:CHAD domain-containing protein [Burkholderia vietnamiensis]|uniref:CHAD domain-containing protein n=1 Tax=Burkholderia vietnamiensis TaxID=60552 RepID=A0ABS1AQS7_BURVI|nr:CHAD domain-containing protein [Burkholderia vietnamiensis]MBJ9686508.1 CHAD domain-containing protein [Burkholderia vietnamiensis]